MESPQLLSSPSQGKKTFHLPNILNKLAHIRLKEDKPPILDTFHENVNVDGSTTLATTGNIHDPIKINLPKSADVLMIKPASPRKPSNASSTKHTLLYRLFHLDDDVAATSPPTSVPPASAASIHLPSVSSSVSLVSSSSQLASADSSCLDECKQSHAPKKSIFISDSDDSDASSGVLHHTSGIGNAPRKSTLNGGSGNMSDSQSNPFASKTRSKRANSQSHLIDLFKRDSQNNGGDGAAEMFGQYSSHQQQHYQNESTSRKELPFLFRHLKQSGRSSSHVTAKGSEVDVNSATTPSTQTRTSGLFPSKTTYSKSGSQKDQAFNESGSTIVVPSTQEGVPASTPSNPKRIHSETSLCEKYGWIEKGCVGRGANGVVRVSHKQDPACPSMEKLYAIKEFRKRNKNESEKSYIKKLTSEFCIGSSLHHENVIQTVDLIQNEQQQWCEVMEYCAGGDLCNMIQHKHLTADEANTYFIQLIHGVAYLHSMGVAHRDLKPENLMLDAKGCLKITDFGEAEVFQSPYERSPHKSKRCCGSQPYMAPEEFIQSEFDPRPIDIFACGIIYLAMIYNRLPWKKPHLDDPNYRYYTQNIEFGFAMIDRLPHGPRELIRKILNPNPDNRPSMREILSDEWFKQAEDLMAIEKKIRQNSVCSLGSTGVVNTPCSDPVC